MKNRPLASAILFLSLYDLSFLACAEGMVNFRGAVIESGCWHESRMPMILCQKKNTIERHILIENLTANITSPNATLEKIILNEDKQLTLIRIVYD